MINDISTLASNSSRHSNSISMAGILGEVHIAHSTSQWGSERCHIGQLRKASAQHSLDPLVLLCYCGHACIRDQVLSYCDLNAQKLRIATDPLVPLDMIVP